MTTSIVRPLARTTVSALALCCATASYAGDEPLYEAAPAWIEPIDLKTIERDPANSQVVNDTQIRVEDGRLWEYSDIVYRVSNSAELSKVGTLTAQWLPDKGDLIVHEISILRDGDIIDLVEQGEEFEVLRRERNLEQRIIDGSLTATMAVPGLEIGDELRLRYSITVSDQALGEEVQSQAFLWREPSQVADFARVRASWPSELDVFYKAGPNFASPAAEQSDGTTAIEITLPLEEADEFPDDAPLRYRRGTLLQVGTFEDWAEVSSVMAPHYETDGSLEGLDDLLRKVEAIRSEHPTDLERAVAALELVQEDIRYLLNGLNGGNYIPQDVATTWENKYGDCKAKTVILLAILRHLGIAAEPVLVSSDSGNVVPISLPLAGAFDHVLVRADIGGNHYYLDGTSLGANMKIVGNVPEFEYALPIRASGATLEPIEQVLPRVADFEMNIEFDVSAGADLPVLTTLRFNLLGPAAVQFNSIADKLNTENKKKLASRFGDEIDLIDVEIFPGEDDSISTMVMTGIAHDFFDFDGERGEVSLVTLDEATKFSPNRSRRDWRELPVAVAQPSSFVSNVRTILPEYDTGYELSGAEPIDVEVARQRYTRKIDLEDRVLRVSERVTSLGGEISPDEIRKERRKASALARKEAKLVAPSGLSRRWRFAQTDDRSALKPLEAAYARIIENDPDEYRSHLKRAAFRYDVYDFVGSLQDMNSVVELESTARFYGQRATVHSQLLDFESYISDLEEAYSLDPSAWRAIDLADAMAHNGDLKGARAILEDQDGDEDVQQSLVIELARLDAMEGRIEDGLLRIEEYIFETASESELLDNQCWYMATWNIEPEEGIDVCTRAVENTDDSANVLDSRALMYLRNGMLEEALKDVEAALELEPDQTASVLLKGLILREMGDAKAEAQVAHALARRPYMAVTYGKWGFDF